MNYFEELRNLGVNVDAGLERVMDDEPFYEMMLRMFIDTVNDNPIELADFDADDFEVLMGRVHTLKGLTGNLEMIPLFMGYVQALELLRMNNPKEALKEYERLLDGQVQLFRLFFLHQKRKN